MNLGKVLKKWRLMSEMDLRTACKLLDIGGAATLMRLEQGYSPSGDTLAKVIKYLVSKEEKTK